MCMYKPKKVLPDQVSVHHLHKSEKMNGTPFHFYFASGTLSENRE